MHQATPNQLILPDCCLMQMPCGNVSLCVVLLHFFKKLCASVARIKVQYALTLHVNITYKADYLWLESHLVCHCGPYSSHIVLYDIVG